MYEINTSSYTNEFLYGIDGLLLPNYLFIPGFIHALQGTYKYKRKLGQVFLSGMSPMKSFESNW
jgi:hypothetical protein